MPPQPTDPTLDVCPTCAQTPGKPDMHADPLEVFTWPCHHPTPD